MYSTANLPNPKEFPILPLPKHILTKQPLSGPHARPASAPAMCIFQPSELRLKNHNAEPTKRTPKAMNAAQAAGTCQ